ncbi:MAG: acetyltransferase [Clostridiales bacterium]|nr:acetyltransferase [Clostridiales bacterium]
MNGSTKANHYIPGLDGLRTLAVFAVIAYHLDLSWAPGGLLGVNLFFVLSGYLITNILQVQWEHSGTLNLKNFWLRRAKRLLPALFVMLAGVMLWTVLFAPERLAALKSEIMAAVFYVSNWYLIFHEVSYFESFGPPSPFGHLWSLAIEEQFYLFWPLLLGLGFRLLRQRKWIIGGTVAIALVSALAMALIYIPGHDPSRVYYGTDTRAFALLLGAALAMVWPSGRLSAELTGARRLALDGAGIFGLLVVLWMIFRTNQYQPFLYQSGLLIFSVAAAVLVAVLAHPASRLSGLFGWGPLCLLGKWSYGIYLWHYPIIVLSSPLVNTGEPDALRSLCQISISVLLAALSYYLIEEPIRFGKVKPLHLSARVSVSMLLIFAVMFVTANGSLQISAGEQGVGDNTQVSGEQIDMEEKQRPSSEEPPFDSQDEAEDKSNDEHEPEGFEEEDIESILDQGSGSVTVIGDSLMVGLAPALEELLPGVIIDAEKGRQMHEAPEVLAKLRKEDKFGETIIIGLGSNGAFTEKQLRATLDCLEGAEQIVLLNCRVPKPWESVVNETLAKVSESYPNTRLVDWYAASRGHDEYFYQDGVHLNPTGAEAYCKMIVEALSSNQEEVQ